MVSAATMNTEDPPISPSKTAMAAVVEVSRSSSVDLEDPVALALALVAVATLASVTTVTTITVVARAQTRIKWEAFLFGFMCFFLWCQLPFLDLARCGLFNSNDLVTVEQTERIIGQF
jgi:hypothetical protein